MKRNIVVHMVTIALACAAVGGAAAGEQPGKKRTARVRIGAFDSRAIADALQELASHDAIRLDDATGWIADAYPYSPRRTAHEVLLESGATLAGAMLEQGMIDEMIIYLAPHLMGDSGRGLFHLPGLAHMAHRHNLRFSDLRQVGPDIRITASPID